MTTTAAILLPGIPHLFIFTASIPEIPVAATALERKPASVTINWIADKNAVEPSIRCSIRLLLYFPVPLTCGSCFCLQMPQPSLLLQISSYKSKYQKNKKLCENTGRLRIGFHNKKFLLCSVCIFANYHPYDYHLDFIIQTVTKKSAPIFSKRD